VISLVYMNNNLLCNPGVCIWNDVLLLAPIFHYILSLLFSFIFRHNSGTQLFPRVFFIWPTSTLLCFAHVLGLWIISEKNDELHLKTSNKKESYDRIPGDTCILNSVLRHSPWFFVSNKDINVTMNCNQACKRLNKR
jgi:hypothetical protein